MAQYEKGDFPEYTGGGTPVGKGTKHPDGSGRGGYEKVGKPGHREEDQPRDASGRFTYNEVNGKPLKDISRNADGESRGTTVPPTMLADSGAGEPVHYKDKVKKEKYIDEETGEEEEREVVTNKKMSREEIKRKLGDYAKNQIWDKGDKIAFKGKVYVMEGDRDLYEVIKEETDHYLRGEFKKDPESFYKDIGAKRGRKTRAEETAVEKEKAERSDDTSKADYDRRKADNLDKEADKIGGRIPGSDDYNAERLYDRKKGLGKKDELEDKADYERNRAEAHEDARNIGNIKFATTEKGARENKEKGVRDLTTSERKSEISEYSNKDIVSAIIDVYKDKGYKITEDKVKQKFGNEDGTLNLDTIVSFVKDVDVTHDSFVNRIKDFEKNRAKELY